MLWGMRSRRGIVGPAAVAAVVACAWLTSAVAHSDPSEKTEAVAQEIARLRAFLGATTASDEITTEIKDSMGPMLAQAEQARADGYPLLALLRLARAQEGVVAAQYLNARSPEERKDVALFEKEWARLGPTLDAAPRAAALEGVTPAAVRALGEAALPQVRVYYEASLEYGRNTQADAGLYYLGAAQAQRDFAEFCRRLASPVALPPPPLRALAPELDALERDLLAAYKAPAAIDRHREFIVASAALKEARELDAAGLRHGAFLRYLTALQRFEPLRPEAPALSKEQIQRAVEAFAARLDASATDPSIGRVFVEYARADLRQATDKAPAAMAAAIVGGIVPRYFQALEPVGPRPPAPAPRVTVTLVRWPYT
jgi:hypothetical protein